MRARTLATASGLLTIGGHLWHAGRIARDGTPLAAPMLFDKCANVVWRRPRHPWRWLRRPRSWPLRWAEAQESTEPLHPRVGLPATSPLGDADSEPDLVAEERAINGLKHQFERTSHSACRPRAQATVREPSHRINPIRLGALGGGDLPTGLQHRSPRRGHKCDKTAVDRIASGGARFGSSQL